MNTITPKNQYFDQFLKEMFQGTNKITLDVIAKTLEKIDDMLAAKRDSELIIIRKSSRTILTSIGKITFRRRYYHNTTTERKIYLLDSILGIQKYSRLSTELKKKIILSLDHLTFEQAGIDNLPEGYQISSSTVFNILNKSIISVDKVSVNRQENSVVHVQIDEKYINAWKSKAQSGKRSNKVRIYTATIFDGVNRAKKRNSLRNRVMFTTRSISKLYEKINYHLQHTFNVKLDEKVYVSGDLATYIQNSEERITVCDVQYVPDKFHVIKDFRQLFGVKLTKEEIFSKDFTSNYLKVLKQDKFINNPNASKLTRLLKKHPESLKVWYNDDYLGCSQEGMNSHYVANRMGKKPNTFCFKSVDKLCLIICAKRNGQDINIQFKGKYYEYKIKEPEFDFSDLFHEAGKRYIQFENYSYPLRKALKGISGLY